MRLLTLWALAVLVGFSATQACAADAAGKHAGLLGGQGQGQAVRQELAAFQQAVRELFEAIKNGGDITAAAQRVRAAWQALPEQARQRIKARIQERRPGAGRGNRADATAPETAAAA